MGNHIYISHDNISHDNIPMISYIQISYSPSTFDLGAPSPRRGSPSLAHVPVIPWESPGDLRMTWGHNGDVTIDKSMIKV